MGPDPTGGVSRTQVDALYECLRATQAALQAMQVPWILTGGSLLGAVRQHSILFCDDDVDLAILVGDEDGLENEYERVRRELPRLLGPDFLYTANAWEGGDRVRWKRVSNVFLDVFFLRRYETEAELRAVIGVKKNGRPQSEDYIRAILDVLRTAVAADCGITDTTTESGSSSASAQQQQLPLFPCWHFAARKAVELWPKEVYRPHDLLPLRHDYKMGPCTHLSGPRMPLLLLKRAFGHDCLEVYYQSISHQQQGSTVSNNAGHSNHHTTAAAVVLPPLVQDGGTWHGIKLALQAEHYRPMQPVARARRRPTLHCRERLWAWVQDQSQREAVGIQEALDGYQQQQQLQLSVRSDGADNDDEMQRPPEPSTWTASLICSTLATWKPFGSARSSGIESFSGSRAMPMRPTTNVLRLWVSAIAWRCWKCCAWWIKWCAPVHWS